MIGAHDWIEEWTEIHRERAPDSDITFVHDRICRNDRLFSGDS